MTYDIVISADGSEAVMVSSRAAKRYRAAVQLVSEPNLVLAPGLEGAVRNERRELPATIVGAREYDSRGGVGFYFAG